MPIPQIPVGAPATAATFNGPLQQLSAQVDRATSLFEASAQGQSYYLRSVPVSSNVVVGTPVYWNSIAQQYQPALAGATTNNYGEFVLTDASDCVGLVTAVFAGNTADIIQQGIADINLSAVSVSVAPGRYYLSSSVAGQLVSAQPPVSVFVCRILGVLDGCSPIAQVLVQPQIRDVLLDHTHYRFPLLCEPAGKTTPPAYGAKHVINSANTGLRGWLPASNPVFNGNAPVGAKFGYNIAQDPNLSAFWPPVPIYAVSLLLNHGIGQGATEVPLGHSGVAICDANGIWWLSDCYGNVPWPTSLNNTVDDSLVGSSIANDECPRPDFMRLDVVYLRMLVSNANYVVTSLATPPGSPLVLAGKLTPNNTYAGDVEISLNANLTQLTTNTTGGLVVKNITSALGLNSGYVIEGLTTSSAGVVLTGTQTRHLTPTDATTPLVYQGVVDIEIDLSPVNKELPPVTLRLEGRAIERLYDDIPYIGLQPGLQSGVRMAFNVPPTGLPTNPKISLLLLLIGRASGTLPTLQLSYRQLAMPALDTVESFVTTDTAGTINTAFAVTANQLIAVQSAAISVNPSDSIFMTLTRVVDSSYAGEIGLIRIGAIISAG